MPEPMSQDEINRHAAVLNESRDSGQIAASAITLAGSDSSDAVAALAPFLHRPEFLGRLDDTADPSSDILNLMAVFRAMAEHPSEATGRLCESLYADAEFGALPARINLLLAALAAVRPTTPEAADIFRASSREGYAEVNAPLLLKNESPLALEVFAELITGDWLEPYVKVDILHRALLPRRTRLPVLGLCARLWESGLPSTVAAALIETLFDYRSRYWFGPAMNPPEPPPWDTASSEALEFLVSLATRLLAGEIEPRLRGPVQSTQAELEAILQSRLQ